MMNSAYSVGTENQTQVKEWTFVTEESLSVNETNILVNTPMQVLKFLQKAFPNQLVEILHKFSFEAKHKHLGENDNKRKTYFSSIPGLKEAISVYSFSKLPSAIARKNPCWLTLSGMMEHLKQKKEAKDPQFEKLLKVLHAPLNTEEWYIYDGGTIDEAINNVAMEAYHSFKRGFKWVRNRLWGKEDNNTLLNTDDTLRQQIYEQSLTWHGKRGNTEPVKYIVTLNDINPNLVTVQDEENATADNSDDIQDNYLDSNWRSKPVNKIAKCFFSALMVSQCIGLGASVSMPPYLTENSVNETNNYCLATNGQCTYVGNANISRLMTECPGGNFIAAENINGSISPLNHTVTKAVVPGQFSGTFSTGKHSLDGFPINGNIPLFKSINNSHIKVNIPVRHRDSYNTIPSLARRALHNNNIETTLQWSNTSNQFRYTYPLTGNIKGDDNRFIMKYDTQPEVNFPHYYFTLGAPGAGIIATKVSGNNNHLEQQGQISIPTRANNYVIGNTAKIITGTGNKLIHKGTYVDTASANIGASLIDEDYTFTTLRGYGILTVSIPIKGTQHYQHFHFGKVCSEGFSQADTFVACRQLGFDEGVQSAPDYQNPPLPILLNNVNCAGNETSLLQCPYDSANEYNCTQPPVSLRCRGTTTYNNDTVLYSGILSRVPDFIAEAPFAFWDKSGYIPSDNKLSDDNSIESINPADWRKAHQHLCASEECNISCHYVNEAFYSVFMNGNKTLLVSRQHYPEAALPNGLSGTFINEAKGLIRVTDISQPGANGTIRLYHPPSDNRHLGGKTLDDPAVYTSPVSHVVTNDTLLMLHRRPKFFRYIDRDFLDFKGETPGVQLSELSLNVTNSGQYDSISYEFPGEDALLLSNNAAFTYNETTNMIIQHPLEHNGERYTLGEANITYQLPSEPFITAGCNEDHLYVVTTGQMSDQPFNNGSLTFFRYDIKTGKKDDSWYKQVQADDSFDRQGSYKLEFFDGKTLMLRRDEFNLNGVPHRFWIPQYGECSKIIRNDQLLFAETTTPEPTIVQTTEPTTVQTTEPTNKPTNELTLQYHIGSDLDLSTKVAIYGIICALAALNPVCCYLYLQTLDNVDN